MITSVVLREDADQYGRDHIYVHGAAIADPYNDPAVVWDESVTPAEPVFVIDVEPAADDRPYIVALAEHGLTVIGEAADRSWLCEQSRPLRAAERGETGGAVS